MALRSPISRRVLLQGSAASSAALALNLFGGGSAVPASAAAGAASAASPAGGPVQLHWLEGVPAAAPGTSFGVPWPRGAYKANARFAAKTDAGEPVPIDTWPLAYWPDGSLKWTGHAVGAGSGIAERLELSAGAPAVPTHRVTARERPGNPLRGIADSVVVSTGVITVTIPKSGAQLISAIARDGRDLATQGELVCLVQNGPTPEYGETSVATQAYTGEIDETVIEQSGPVRAVVRAKGRYRNSQDRRWLPFTVRLYFYSGAESVRIVHGFIFDGDQHTDFIRGLGLRWRVPMSDELHNRHIRFVGENDGVWAEAVRVISGLRRDPGNAARNAQRDGVVTPPLSQWGDNQNWSVQINDVPVWNDYKLVQNSADSFHVAKRTGAHSTWQLHAGHGRRALGLGWVGGPTGGGIAFGLRDFWERHPTQLDIRDAGGPQAIVTVWFWSPDQPAMDLRHYDDRRHDLPIMYEEPGRGLEDRVATPEGVARSNEVMLWALPSTPTRARLLELTKAMRTPPLLVADPEYYHSQRPFGVWSLPDRSTPARNALEDDIDRRIAFYQRQIQQRKWYGFWHYGDVMHSYDTTRHVWRYDSGGHAWQQGELAPDLGLWYQFLRTGRHDVFRMAEAMTLSIAEAAVHHAGFFAGLGSRHNVSKWGDGSKEVRISASHLKRFYYYLTADERTGDYMDATLQVDETMVDVPPLRQALPAPSGRRYIVRIGPDWIGMAANWMTKWERTGDTAYLDRITTGLRDIAAMQMGMFTGQGGSVAFDPATARLEDVGISQSGSNISLLFGGDQVFYEILDLVDVPEFTEEFMNFCVARTGTNAERIELYGRNFNPGGFLNDYGRLMAFAGHRLGEDSYKQRAWATFNPNQNVFPQVREIAPPAVLTPVEEAGNIYTNDSGQRMMNIIQLLELAPNQAP